MPAKLGMNAVIPSYRSLLAMLIPVRVLVRLFFTVMTWVEFVVPTV
jgi:hypothetical protein